MNRIIPAAALALALAGCTTAAQNQTPPSHPVTAPHAAKPAAAATGPFGLTTLRCGRYTPAQADEFGTDARGGFVYRVTDTSSTLTAEVQVDAEFTDGSVVAGENVTTTELATLSPGQSAVGAVDAVGGSGQNLTFSGCQIESYTVADPATGTTEGTYQP